MNTSSFLCGVLMGAAASMIMSKKRSAMMSSLLHTGGSSESAGEKAKDKIMGMAMTGFGSTAEGSSHDNGSHASGSSEHKKEDSPVKSKESNLNMLKDFIRSNPDVKHEVEQILKDTHTAIPGL
ncbi:MULTISPECIES: hypothetical protein [Paenibacillus]|jgi:hypothetical protein|uniref:hypothetical protein n=1 Tax=Paenibacillus TaxID=44249 RepID=UPI0004F8B9EE|nr:MULTISPECIES: hypothetical protein [unclassified Paenibacillus]AIQ30859.1 hypothetical protein P40081_23830 [Paenibacillus sp. FSL P4-0081]AIQ42428.1 hypothetical protein R50912_22045 [Paenibacillus sp. FSL R5-0912]KHL94339.1 hypothetical protein QW71_18645 [Paenibacillus sp. IHB B 3415]OMF30428.1 hypothetical protein BK132_09790 [Paenibacillus sp. FSL H8-0259]